MILEGTKVKVFKEKHGDGYHKQGEYKSGVVLKKYPNFCLLWLENSYRECFRENELIEVKEKDDKDN